MPALPRAERAASARLAGSGIASDAYGVPGRYDGVDSTYGRWWIVPGSSSRHRRSRIRPVSLMWYCASM